MTQESTQWKFRDSERQKITNQSQRELAELQIKAAPEKHLTHEAKSIAELPPITETALAEFVKNNEQSDLAHCINILVNLPHQQLTELHQQLENYLANVSMQQLNSDTPVAKVLQKIHRANKAVAPLTNADDK